MPRLFAAIRPPEPVRELLIDAMHGVPGLRWQDDGQLHLTLRFIGEVERPLAEDIALALGQVRFERFATRVAGVGRFEQRGRGALWAGVEPRGPLAALAAKLERVCVGVGLAPERRTFHPHITLARWGRSGAVSLDPFLARHAALIGEPFEVYAFHLFQSHLGRDGAHYEAVCTVPSA